MAGETPFKLENGLIVIGQANVTGNVVITGNVTFAGNTTFSSQNIGNVYIGTDSISIGNSTINTTANSSFIKISNSTVNTSIGLPTSGQYAATNYFLHANGSWVQISAGAGATTPGGANTYIQYNDSGAFNGSAGFTFDNTTNNVSIANTLNVGANVIVNTSSVKVGNSTVNATVNSTAVVVANSTTNAVITPINARFGNSTYYTNIDSQSIKIANSTVNTNLIVPTAGQYAATNYFLHANGTWVQVVIPTPGGANTQVTFNDSGAFNGSAGFTFDKATNNAVVANTLSIGVNVVANTSSVKIGNSTVNAVSTSTSLSVVNSTTNTVITPAYIYSGNSTFFINVASQSVKIANSTSNTGLVIPTAGQYAATNYFLHANGTWVQINPVSTPGGSDTYIQYNDGGTLSGSAGFTFNKTTNNAVVANTLSVGSNVVLDTTSVKVGNSTVNSFSNSTVKIVANSTTNTVVTPAYIYSGNSTFFINVASQSIKIANSTSNTGLLIPTAGQYAATNYFLHANGTWVQVVLPTPGGSNTQITFNDSGAFNGSAGFTFDKATNNAVVANTLSVGANVVLNTSSVKVGNSTVNSSVNSTVIFVSNSTTNTVITPAYIYSGNSTFFINVASQSIYVANSTTNTGIVLPTAGQYAATNYFLHANGSWVQISVPSVGGSNTYLQFNDSGALGGTAGFTFDKATNNAVVANTLSVGADVIVNTSAVFVGNSTVNASITSTQIKVTNATSNVVITPQTIFVGNSTANVTGNSIYFAVSNSTVQVAITPKNVIVGVSEVNSTGMFIGANVATNTSAIFVGNSTVNAIITQSTIDLDGTGTFHNLRVSDDKASTGTMYDVGFKESPPFSNTGSLTFALTDSAKTKYKDGGAAATWTVPTNASVAFANGTVMTSINLTANTLTIARATGVTLILAGVSGNTNISVAQNGMLTLHKISTDTWIAAGSGIS
jgi:hypothetical protein